MGKYATEWAATCPKCDKSITPEMLVCKTCEKGIIKALPRTYGLGTLGCEKCDTEKSGFLYCPDCKTQIPAHFVKVSEGAIKAEATRVKKEQRKGGVIVWGAVIGVPILVLAPFAGLLPTLFVVGFIVLIGVVLHLPQIIAFIASSIGDSFRDRG